MWIRLLSRKNGRIWRKWGGLPLMCTLIKSGRKKYDLTSFVIYFNLVTRTPLHCTHRGTAFMSMFQCCFLWDSDKVYQNLIFDTFVINDPHQFFNTSKVNTQNIVFCIKCFFLATSFTRFSAISFCFLAVISKPNVQFR